LNFPDLGSRWVVAIGGFQFIHTANRENKEKQGMKMDSKNKERKGVEEMFSNQGGCSGNQGDGGSG